MKYQYPTRENQAVLAVFLQACLDELAARGTPSWADEGVTTWGRVLGRVLHPELDWLSGVQHVIVIPWEALGVLHGCLEGRLPPGLTIEPHATPAIAIRDAWYDQN